MPLVDDNPDEFEGIFKLLTFGFVVVVVVVDVVPDAALVVVVVGGVEVDAEVVAVDNVDDDESTVADELTTSPESNMVN